MSSTRAAFAARNAQRQNLQQIAAETVSILPRILGGITSIDATASSAYNLETLQPLNSGDCPGFTLPTDYPEPNSTKKGTRIRVFNQDTFDAALDLQPGTTISTFTPTPPQPPSTAPLLDSNSKATAQTSDQSTISSPSAQPKPVLVLNLASDLRPGGGWLNGALAQEEALCYRSSLSLSLHRTYYPLAPLTAIYSPNVVLIRDAMARGHAVLWPDKKSSELPVVSVVSIAAVRRPPLKQETGGFVLTSDKERTKSKIKTVLRIAAHQGHRKLVLGALGCGAFMNPPEDVAICFLDVFREEEFQRGWWEDVVFAVLDNKKGEEGGKAGGGNFGLFWRTLDGVVV